MKILVCGGRSFEDRKLLFEVLDKIHEETPFSHVIHGGATGADNLAGRWARSRGVQEVRCDANWTSHGRSAGIRRNCAMLELGPEKVMAFPGGNGTAHMVRIAKDSKIPVHEVAGEPGSKIGSIPDPDGHL